ncbi:hypothetical protein M9Y10_027128 [Tritrichomonas musculus]|uniref:Uncharacterized protein n=1 Tax=Tritrichomonas musculus TaxID=1915356 RepID=A0ABR2H5L3_9EUKA
MNLLVKIIRETIDHKEEIVNHSPEVYTTRMRTILTALLSQKDSKYDPRVWEQSQNFLFFILPAELRDEIITEYIQQGRKIIIANFLLVLYWNHFLLHFYSTI